MKTSVIEVHDMLTVFSVDEVEKRIGEVPGVGSVTVNHSAGNATVRFDETRLEIADIKSAVRQRGYENAPPAAVPTGDAHEGHATPEALAAPDAPKSLPKAPSTPGTASTGSEKSNKGTQDAAQETKEPDSKKPE